MARFSWLLLLLLCLPGCASRSSTVLGVAPEWGPVTAVRALTPTSSDTVIAGRMTEKCPVAGCWFMLQDRTGTVKVDTREAGFVVTDVPVGAQVKVVGRLKTAGERRFAAVGMRY